MFVSCLYRTTRSRRFLLSCPHQLCHGNSSDDRRRVLREGSARASKEASKTLEALLKPSIATATADLAAGGGRGLLTRCGCRCRPFWSWLRHRCRGFGGKQRMGGADDGQGEGMGAIAGQARRGPHELTGRNFKGNFGDFGDGVAREGAPLRSTNFLLTFLKIRPVRLLLQTWRDPCAISHWRFGILQDPHTYRFHL